MKLPRFPVKHQRFKSVVTVNSRHLILPFLTGILLYTLCTTLSASEDIASTLEQFVRNNASSVPPLTQVRKMSAHDIGISKKNRRAFIRHYKSFLAEYAKVRKEYHNYPAVTRFTALRYCNQLRLKRPPLSPIPSNEPGNSLYMAFALMTGAGIDYEEIGDSAHLKLLATSYGVEVTEVTDGIRETLTRDWEQILNLIVTMIDDECRYSRSGDKSRFLRNSLHPYMTFLSRGYTIAEQTERKVLDGFDDAFPGRKKNLLRKYVKAFKAYVDGGTMEIQHDIALNNRLKEYGFRMTIGINQCVTYELLPFRIPVNKSGIGEVLFKKRTGVVLLGLDKGMATYSAKDITLTYDHITDETNDINIILTTDSLPVSYHDGADRLWKQIGSKMTKARANSLYRECVRKEFGGKSTREIADMVVKQIATHELKHKWDEVQAPDADWLNVDMEMSAHLTEAVYGGCPIYGLFNLINRAQKYYASIEHPQVRAKLKPIIIEGWDIAESLSENKVPSAIVTKKLLRIYRDYITLRGKKLPHITTFKSEIMDGPLKKIPSLNI